MDVAANRVGVAAIPSTFIGPASPTSEYLGEETIVNGLVSETAVPIMFRCVWGSGTQSRHVLVRIKPSVSEHALALRLCQIFGIPTTGGVFMEPVFKWMPGLMPYSMGMDKGKSIPNDLLKNVPCANKPLVLPFADVVQKLGSTLSGIVDLDVLICDEKFDSCTLCENKAVLDLAVSRNARIFGVGEGVMCERCAQRGGYPVSFPQMDSRNGYIRVTPPG